MSINLFDYPVVFCVPERLSGTSTWEGLIPVAFFLCAIHKPRSFVELGTHKGDSYLAFCQAVAKLNISTRCYAIDTWGGDDHAGHYGEDILKELSCYHDQHYKQFSILIQTTFDEALKKFDDGTIDLLHIDGLHSYEAVRHDYENWLSKMSDRGIILFHDINVLDRGFGVWKLWEELCSKAKGHVSFEHSCGLGVLQIGDNQDPVLKELFAMDKQEWEIVSTAFMALGRGITEKSQANSARKEVMRLLSEIDAARTANEDLIKQLDNSRININNMAGQLDIAAKSNNDMQEQLENARKTIADLVRQIDVARKNIEYLASRS